VENRQLPVWVTYRRIRTRGSVRFECLTCGHISKSDDNYAPKNHAMHVDNQHGWSAVRELVED
jgi:uncharacterized C2H2 Zn-finger protein